MCRQNKKPSHSTIHTHPREMQIHRHALFYSIRVNNGNIQIVQISQIGHNAPVKIKLILGCMWSLDSSLSYLSNSFFFVLFCRFCCLWVRLQTIRTGVGWPHSTTLCWQEVTHPAAKHFFTTVPNWASGMRTAGMRHIRYTVTRSTCPLLLGVGTRSLPRGV